MATNGELYKIHNLSNDLEEVLEAAKSIILSSLSNGPTQAKLSVVRKDIKYDTALIYLRKEDATKAEQFKTELLLKFPDGEFDKIDLLTTKIIMPRDTCSNCGKEMQCNNLARHVKTCGGEKCPVCLKKVKGDLQEHIDLCNVRIYRCMVCGEGFNTGARRTAHQKKCTVSGAFSESERTAIGGSFRIIELKPKYKTFDYEGFLQDAVEHISDILSNKLETGIKFYISLHVDMKMPMSEDTALVTFQTNVSVLFPGFDIEAAVVENIKEIVTNIEEYIANGSGWVVETVNMINLMITKYQPLAINN